MNILKHHLTGLVFLIFLIGPLNGAFAFHFHSAEIYWECLPSGQFKFFVVIYKDCSSETAVDPPGLHNNVPGLGDLPLSLVAGYPQDLTAPNCGLSCADGVQDLSIEKYLFESSPVTLNGSPPLTGYTFFFKVCCRIDAGNMVNSQFQTLMYSATMYPFNGQNINPCFDNSPHFEEPPQPMLCSGYEMRYNSNAIDIDLDSLSYEFITPQVDTGGATVNYQPGFSSTQPFPGPSPTTLNPTTGQISYDSSPSVSGRYTIALKVNAWRCGQLVSSSIRDMTFAFAPCSPNNNIPIVAPPVWNSPPNVGYSVTVEAGSLVNFTLEGVDADLINGQSQNVELTAEGVQFGTNFTDPNSGCLNTPCATLSNSTPPANGIGNVSTQFNWQTTCDHVGIYDQCGNLTNTYNFLFKFKDDYCPASGLNMVNVAVTVVGDKVVESPQPHCVSNDGSGNITLFWEPVIDNSVPQSFVEYVISHSISPTGPFNEVGTVADINTGTWTHNLSNSSPPITSGPNYYLIQTRSGCNGSVVLSPRDTVSSIYLTVQNTGATADLSWTPVATPPLASSNGNGQGLYKVFKEFPSGVWTEIGTTFEVSYSDPITVCLEEFNYRIELTDNLPCTSVSNIDGDIFSNADTPEPQAIDSVSVDPTTGLVTVCWSPSLSTNVDQYNVYWNPDQNAYDLLATVQGYNNTCWTDPSADPMSGPLWYQVTATNNCGQEGLAAGDGSIGTNRHETIWLTDSINGCEREAYLNWTRYWYWEEGVREYEIYSSKDGQSFQKIGTVPDSIRTYTHQGLDEEAVYCHYVRAIQESNVPVSATSNSVCSYVYVPDRPDYGYNYNTTVQPGNAGIEEYFFSDSIAGYLGFEIQRGTEPNALSYQWFVPFDPNTRYYSYVDAGARPESNSYYYSVIGVDSCDQYADTLNMSRTILLEAEANSDRTNSLLWNPYEGWNGGVTAYNIYRSIDGPFEFLTTVPPNQLTYLDTVQEILIGEGNFCYYIEAVEGIGTPVGTDNPVTFMELSRSNEDCAPQLPNVFIPNAFMPEGVNNIFKPVTVYVQTGSYLFQVYDRWGNRVFETTDPDQGWNGSSGSKKNPQGAYVYFISFVSSTDQTYTKTGSVTLIR